MEYGFLLGKGDRGTKELSSDGSMQVIGCNEKSKRGTGTSVISFPEFQKIDWSDQLGNGTDVSTHQVSESIQ